MRLSLFVAKSGAASRRKADVLIQDGKVSINDKVVREPYYRVKPSDNVSLEGKPVRPLEKSYYILNKPCGVTTTMADPFAERKISEYFPKGVAGLYPAGRLDRDSSGLIIVTNDGDFCYALTHPKFEIEKEYVVKLAGFFTMRDTQRALKGVRDQDDLLKVKAIEMLTRGKELTRVKVLITEGKKRHLRRLFGRLGFNVLELARVRIGRLLLKDLPSGEYRLMSGKVLSGLVFAREGQKPAGLIPAVRATRHPRALNTKNKSRSR
jgi:23S rRNA pseudouridine2605 synthase